DDPVIRHAFVVNNTTAGFFGLNGGIIPCNAFADNADGAAACGAASQFGFRAPDIVLNARVDQQWGFAGVSAAMHDVSGAYYTPGATVSVNNGHPADKWGWAAAAGGRVKPPRGGAILANLRGAPRPPPPHA